MAETEPSPQSRERRVARGGVVSAVALALALAAGAAAGQGGPATAGSPAGAAAAPPGGSAAKGEQLFAGRVGFANGGPPCSSCHAVSALPFPGGGTMGPDLSDAYAKYGFDALDAVLTTLFFPTMNPLFAGRLLTPAERADLEAFLAAAAGRPPARASTAALLGGGLLACAAAIALIAWLGRARLRGVRAALVRARRSQGVPS